MYLTIRNQILERFPLICASQLAEPEQNREPLETRWESLSRTASIPHWDAETPMIWRANHVAFRALTTGFHADVGSPLRP